MLVDARIAQTEFIVSEFEFLIFNLKTVLNVKA